MSDGQNRITVWRREKPTFHLNEIKIYNFQVKQRRNITSFSDKLESFVLALLHTEYMLKSHVIMFLSS